MLATQYYVTVLGTGYAEVLNEQFDGPYVPGANTQPSVTLGDILPTLRISTRTDRYLSLVEQRVLQQALRASVTIVHKAKRVPE